MGARLRTGHGMGNHKGKKLGRGKKKIRINKKVNLKKL